MDATVAAAPLETDSADGVFEGGGVKGIAFVGALEAAEEFGIARWVNVAGTSAGAIVASLLAMGESPSRLRGILEKMDYATFADYGWGGKYIGGARNALRGRGLCPGKAFTDWLAERFSESPMGKPDPTFADVQRELPAGLTDKERARAGYRLRVIASDVTEGRMLVLPDDIEDYEEDEQGRPLRADALPIVSAVRMSMSFPYFFEPVTLYRDGQPHLIVDGGLLSNFPVFLFDGDKPPLRRWTFGFRLFSGAPPERPPYRRVPRVLWRLAAGQGHFLLGDRGVGSQALQGERGAYDQDPDWRRADSQVHPHRRRARCAAHVRALRRQAIFNTQDRYLNHAGMESAGPAAV